MNNNFFDYFDNKLVYCDQCGYITTVSVDKKTNRVLNDCICCNKKLILVPQEYLHTTQKDTFDSEEKKKQFIEKVIKTSPNFDQYYHVNREAIIKRDKDFFRAANEHAKQKENVPKCPTCGSTNIRKIGALERGTSASMFGLFSKKINKSFECKNCGYTW